MTSMRDFFDINFEIVLFISGLVFFVLGLAVSLQSRRYSRLQLAGSLGWLAIFGVAHGMHEWGMLFIPIQAQYMNPLAISLLQIIQVGLLGIALFALFSFGADLLRERRPNLRLVPYLMTIVWLIVLVLIQARSPWGVGWLQQQASILAKYLLAVPGALLSAYGLYYQGERYIRPHNLPTIYRTMIVASVTLVLYALFAGLFVPYGSFFPANQINQSLVVRVLGIPAPVILSLIGLLFALTVMRVLEVFDLETGRLIDQIRLEQSLAMERENIGREIHDGAIQTIYTAGLIIESAKRRVEGDPILSKRMDRAMTALNETVASLRANMNELRNASISTSLSAGLRQRTQDPRLTTLMTVKLKMDLPESSGFNSAQTNHILAIVSEALTNAARHASPSTAQVEATTRDGFFIVDVSDDGQGFAPQPTEASGYGLRNMRDRARLLGGKLTIDSAPGKGTHITLKVPWEAE
jgi:signal transduction histidine kinase